MSLYRSNKTHELKTWPGYYREVVALNKTFEIRKEDRDFNVGDTLRLVEWDPSTGTATGNSFDVKVVYIMKGGMFGLQEGYVAMGISPLRIGNQ